MLENDISQRVKILNCPPQVELFVWKVSRLVDYSAKAASTTSRFLNKSYIQEVGRLKKELENFSIDRKVTEWGVDRFVKNGLYEEEVIARDGLFADKENIAAYFCVNGKLPDNLLIDKNGSKQNGEVGGIDSKKEQPSEIIIFDAKESTGIMLKTTHPTTSSSRKRKTPQKPKGATSTILKKQNEPNAVSKDPHERVKKRRENIIEEIKKEINIDDSLLNKDLIAIYRDDPVLRIRPERRTPEESALFKEIVLAMANDYMQKDIAVKLKVSVRQVAYAIQSMREKGIEIVGPEIVPSRDPIKESLDRRAEIFMDGQNEVLNEELAIYLGVSIDIAKKAKRRIYARRRYKNSNKK
jgi:hypothetical protein